MNRTDVSEVEWPKISTFNYLLGIHACCDEGCWGEGAMPRSSDSRVSATTALPASGWTPESTGLYSQARAGPDGGGGAAARMGGLHHGGTLAEPQVHVGCPTWVVLHSLRRPPAHEPPRLPSNSQSDHGTGHFTFAPTLAIHALRFKPRYGILSLWGDCSCPKTDSRWPVANRDQRSGDLVNRPQPQFSPPCASSSRLE